MIKNLRYVFASLLMLVCGSAFAEDIIWQEDWSGFTVDNPAGVKENYSFTGTNFDNDGKVTGGTKIYLDAAIAGGTAPELLIAKSGGSFAAVVDLGGKSGDMILTFKTNRNDLKVEVEGATMGDKQRTGNDDTYVLTVAEGTPQITITFKMTTSSNARLDNIKLYQGTAKKPAGLSWGKASTTVTIGQEFTLVLSNENNLPVTYTSSEPTVATIDEAGVITLVAAGKTTLTATFEGNDEYEAQSVSIELTVKADEGGGGGGGEQQQDVKVVTIAEFNAAEVSTSVWYQLTGVVKNLKDGDIYGNFDLEDETGSVYVYGLLSEKGGEKKKFQELVATYGIANDVKITIIGTRGVFNGTIEVLNAYFVRVESGDSDKTKTIMNFSEDYETRATCGKDKSIALPTATVTNEAGEAIEATVTWSITKAKDTDEDIVELQENGTLKILDGVQGSVTIKAQYAGNDTYASCSKGYTFTVYKGYSTLSVMFDEVNNGNEKWDNGGDYISYWLLQFEEMQPVNNTVVYANNMNIYLTDGECTLLFYGENKLNLKKGDVINGDFGDGKYGAIWGKLYRYHKLPEFSFTDMEVKVVAEGAEVTPVAASSDELNEHVNEYVVIENAEYKAVDTSNAKKFTFNDGVDFIVFNQLGVDVSSLTVGAKYTIYGMGGIRDTEYQFYPIEFVKTADPTGITAVNTTVENDAVYNLNGQRVEKAVRGLYIINGKKVMK